MDKKFRISFYPKDASRVKVVSLSRRLGVLAACLLVPLSILGVWLLFAGPLHEPPETRRMRQKLAEENRALKARVGTLNRDMQDLRTDLTRLEEAKVNALMLSGIEYMDGADKRKKSSLFSFFQNLSPAKRDISGSLARARTISASLDSTLELLAGQGDRVASLPTSSPVSREAKSTREFGHSPDPFTGRKAMHAGVDFSHHAGAPIYAAGGGTVSEAGKDLLWGNCVRIDHGRGIETFYAHLQDLKTRRGQRVARGEVIGTMGMTGVSTGVHLHYELTVRNAKVDPMNFFLPDPYLAAGREVSPPGS